MQEVTEEDPENDLSDDGAIGSQNGGIGAAGVLSGFAGLAGFPGFGGGIGGNLSGGPGGVPNLGHALASGMNNSSAAANLLQFLRSSSPRGVCNDLNGPSGLPASLASSLSASLGQGIGGLGPNLVQGFNTQNGPTNHIGNPSSPSQDGESRSSYWGQSMGRGIGDRQENSGSPSMLDTKVRFEKIKYVGEIVVFTRV